MSLRFFNINYLLQHHSVIENPLNKLCTLHGKNQEYVGKKCI